MQRREVLLQGSGVEWAGFRSLASDVQAPEEETKSIWAGGSKGPGPEVNAPKQLQNVLQPFSSDAAASRRPFCLFGVNRDLYEPWGVGRDSRVVANHWLGRGWSRCGARLHDYSQNCGSWVSRLPVPGHASTEQGGREL